MELREICLLLVSLSAVYSIKCKCTKESETVTCYDGVCEMEGGSCLMLDHPSMGMHYTCHTRGLKDGSCRNKTSKSGADVRICGCDASDFCNYSYWPDKSAASSRQHRDQTAATNTAESRTTVLSMTSFSALAVIFAHFF